MNEFLKGFIAFEHCLYVLITGYIIAFATLVGATKGIIEFFDFIKQRRGSSDNYKVCRRNILKLSLISIFLSFGGFLGKSYVLKKEKKQYCLNIMYNLDIVANSKSKVVHLRGISDGLLPSARKQTKFIDLNSFYPYKGYERRIFEALGTEAIQQKNDKLAVFLYQKAIKYSPLSYHLYDKLTRIYGRQKKYANIRKLFENALADIEQMTICKRHYSRAKFEFKFRLNRTLKRSGLA